MPKTETKDDDSDVEFVPMTCEFPEKNEYGKNGGAGDRSERMIGATAVNRVSTDDKRSSTSITIKNSNNKPVISNRPPSTDRFQPMATKRILNAAVPKLQTEPNASPQSTDAGAKLSTASAPRTVNVVTRQNDGTVILRKVQMASKQTVVTVKRPTSGSQLPKSVQSNVAPVNGPVQKRMKIDLPVESPAVRPKEIDPKRKTLTVSATRSTRGQIIVRPRTAVDANKIIPKHRRTVNADNVQPQDAEKAVTMTPLSASEHQYAKRTNENDAITSEAEKPSPQTPLSATEHHYSKRNSDCFPMPATARNRWRPTATSSVVATAADSTRTDEIKSISTTMAPSTTPVLLNEVLRRMKPSIRVRSVQSLNNNNKNG